MKSSLPLLQLRRVNFDVKVSTKLSSSHSTEDSLFQVILLSFLRSGSKWRINIPCGLWLE